VIRRAVAAVRAWWEEMAPMVSHNSDTFIERWDGKGEGQASCFAFEGFGLSFSLFIGRMPPKREGE
jgi:hypothetical protein